MGLSNHDNPRHRSRYGGSEKKARAAAILLLTLRGTPFLFQGEELGLTDADVPPERQVDPGGRDGVRAPIPWDASPSHGWPGEPWLPWPPEPDTRNVDTERADARSILHLYRRLLSARRNSPALRFGSWRAVDSPPGVLAYERASTNGDDRRIVVVNFTDVQKEIELPGEWTIEIASDGDQEGEHYRGRVSADQALILT